VSLDINKRELADLDEESDQDEPATKKSYLDYYGNRKSSPHLIQAIEDNHIISFLHFCIFFEIIKNKLVPRKKPEKIVIITTPQVTFNTKDPKKYQKYCFYQYIKYTTWDFESIKVLTLENAIQLWEEFIIDAHTDIQQAVE